MLHVNALPTVAVAQTGAVVTTGWPATVIVEVALAEDTLLPSLATTLMILLPFEEQLIEMLPVDDVPAQPVGRVHVYE